MLIKVLFFARSREVCGVSEVHVELPDGSSTHDLLASLTRTYAGLDSVMRSCVFALNQDYVPAGEGVALKEGDEVAVIPPLSGG